MVVKEDGTKWACASCLKGHRVSGCTHTERDLTFVPKKGRPVTQCNHCRSERKKRSAHNRCDCGDKLHTKDKCKEKCIHLRQAEAEAAAAAAAATDSNGTTTPPINNTVTDSIEPHAPISELYQLPEESPAEEHHCCCPHGGKCTCSGVKRETPDKCIDVLPKASHARPKPSLTSHRSEGHLTIFANGHHKPVHRNNNAAHESGVPYKLPRHHSNQGASIARRSVDSLASVKSVSPPRWTQPAPTNAIPVNQEPPVVQSERNSPHSDYSVSYEPVFNAPGLSMDTTSYPMPEVSASVPNTTFQDFGYPSAASGLSINTTSTEPAMSVFSLPTSGIEVGPDYWSGFDWNKLDNNTFEAQPALTNASSGTISEIDDLPRVDDLGGFDAQYSIDGQAQVANIDFGTDYCNANNNYSSSLNMGGSFSNRWSMPTFTSQDNSAAFLPSTAERSVKDLSGQTFGNSQSIQPAMSNGAMSTQSLSPVAMASEGMYQNEDSGLSNYNWDSLLPEYNTATSNDSMNETLDFAINEPTQNAVMNDQCTQRFQNDGTGNYDGFDDSYRTMQWNEGVTMPAAPADQDYINTFNLDSNWNFGTFENQWS